MTAFEIVRAIPLSSPAPTLATCRPSSIGSDPSAVTTLRRAEVDPSSDVDGWPRTGEVPSSDTALVWVSPERARWAREERTVTSELSDGSVIVEVAYAGTDWLVKEILKEAGDAAVIEPKEARKAVLTAATELVRSSKKRPAAKPRKGKPKASTTKAPAKPGSRAGATR